jgi:hypothetical protein
MAQIRQYRPAYFSGFENETKAFTSLRELLKNGYSWWVVGFVDENEIIKELPVWTAKYEAG